MNYWLNVHWPPLAKDKPKLPSPLPDPEYQYRVYLPHSREDAGKELKKGDYVFIYETKTGRTLKTGEKCAVGREGIIAFVVALTPVLEKPDEEPEEYLNGSVLWWKWQARTQVKELGFCTRKDVCRILGYKENYTLRGFGDHRSGLKKLSEKKFRELLKAFRKEENEEVFR